MTQRKKGGRMTMHPRISAYKYFSSWRTVFLFFGCLVFLFPSAHAWEIDNFEIKIEIFPNAAAKVIEVIVADFGGENRHGIYRDIPVGYYDRAGQHFRMRMKILGVYDALGRPWNYKLETYGRYQRLRIGDQNQTVTGKQTYWIMYEVTRGAVRFFPDHDELYWNLTGNEWGVAMRHVRAEISLPAAAQNLRAIGFMGEYGSRAQIRAQVAETSVVYEPARELHPYEGLTAVVGWDKGVVFSAGWLQRLAWWFEDNWMYGIPFAILIFMLANWYERGRDPELQLSELVEYQPPDGFSPAETGTLLDERVHIQDIIATVIDLAVRGYLKIEPLTSTNFLGQPAVSDYLLKSVKPWQPDPSIKPHEKIILDGIFPNEGTQQTLSELKERFYQHLPEIRNKLYKALFQARLFDGNPEKIRMGYLAGGALLGFIVLIILLLILNGKYGTAVPSVIASVLSALIVMAFSRIMPRRTIRGAHLAHKIKGFVEFLKRTDQDRLKRLNDPTLFEKYLPYALAFGVTTQWAKAFDGLYQGPPSWYAGGYGTFSTTRFCHDLHHASMSIERAFVSQPRSEGGSSGSWGGSGFGGGGFSGGGGGGGGGGPW